MWSAFVLWFVVAGNNSNAVPAHLLAVMTADKRKSALIINDTGRRSASAIVRALQYQTLFERCASWRAEYTSRHSEALARILWPRSHRSIPLRVLVRALRLPLRAYQPLWERRREEEILERAADFDIVSVIKLRETKLYRRLCTLRRPRIIVDINDAVWLPRFGWHDLPAILGEVHGVICENDYVAEYARQFNSCVIVVPDAPQIEVFDKFRNEVQRDPQQIVLGWIGEAETIGHLYRILEPLESLFARHPQLHLRVVGLGGGGRLPNFENVGWSCRPFYNQEEMVREVLGFDIGLFPLFHNEDARGRGTLKAKVYMSGQVAVVCEDYGGNPALVKDGINGLLASSPQQWYEQLERLIVDPDLRAVIARRGMETVRANFTAERVFGQLLGAFEKVCDSAVSDHALATRSVVA